LINILIEGSKLVLDDIVKGKTGGIIVLATGEPGTGKTLTAEVYSESVCRPLYTVQCSQLGTGAVELEEKLTKTLARAVRWNAILLIDEADVYIHERGNDINQNAIVGVFLRVLEYYRGILFLTSNRATIIDDAVLSRLTAHVRYEVPTAADAIEIWRVLSEQYKIKTKDSLAEISKAFLGVSGRTIKNLLKLSKLLADREKKQVSLGLVKYAAQFLDGVNRQPSARGKPESIKLGEED
jgi:SpoVK/Ycf46/Vps4 family AAA+-type ATPase